MEKGEGKVRIIIINSIRFLLLLAFIGALYTGRNLVLIFSALGLIATLIPNYLNFFDIKIPSIYEIIVVLFIYGVLFLGEIRGLFAEFWWWGILLNFIGSIILGFVGFTVLYVLYKEKKINTNPFIIVILTFCFILAMGTIWELFKFILDIFLGFNMQKSLLDTMLNLSVNAIGAFIISFLGYSYIKEGKIKIVSEFVLDLVEKNPKIFSSKTNLELSSDEIKRIISIGESEKIEFKSTLRTNLHTNNYDEKIEYSIMKTIAAFLNSEGGTLLIGIGDKGNIQGLEKDNFPSNDKLSLYFTNLLKKYLGNEHLQSLQFGLFPIQDKHVLKVECSKSKKPVFLKINNDEEFYIRKGPSSIKLSARELVAYIENKFKRD